MGKLITIPTTQGDVKAYEAKPAGVCRGGIIVIHEIWGLDDHIKAVADRFAAEDYYTIAPDLLSGFIDVGKAVGFQEDLFNPEKSNTTQPKITKTAGPDAEPGVR